ncbi:MAG: hypothetical protein SGI71_12385 [Verrucomicrobiota bacterium]|nr:hypothetical protein [Verrucomicrobiota bacterium]
MATPEGQMLFINTAGQKLVGLKDDADVQARTVFVFLPGGFEAFS